MKIVHYALIVLLNITFAQAMDIIKMSKQNYIDTLPLELHDKIIKDIFSLIIHENKGLNGHINQEIVQKCFLKIPVLLGIKFADEFLQLKKMCEKEIGFKKFLAQDLFVLPHQERDVFVRMANRSQFQLLTEGNISVDDYNIIMTIKNEDIKKGLQLCYVHINKIANYSQYIGIGSTLFSFLPMMACFWVGRNESMALAWICSAYGGLGLYAVSQFWRTPKNWISTGLRTVYL